MNKEILYFLFYFIFLRKNVSHKCFVGLIWGYTAHIKIGLTYSYASLYIWHQQYDSMDSPCRMLTTQASDGVSEILYPPAQAPGLNQIIVFWMW